METRERIEFSRERSRTREAEAAPGVAIDIPWLED